MKRFSLVLSALLLASLLCHAQTQNDQEAMQKAWMEYMTPGEMHKMLAEDDGEWTSEITFWMAPDAPPTTTSGTSTNRMIMDGRYQESVFSGEMNGMPFEGIGVTGYDKARKVFVTTWIDNMGTGMMYLEGQWNEADKSITFRGTMTDPLSGGEVEIKQVIKRIDEDTQVMEMYDTRDGNEFKSMEIKMTRK
ncbi:uncharacterized protein DUF1579 [Anseongella ginsenosidimutans]|uniref:Uncharacterized protein DUF1579 n=1 Tax=Anseongella ginsenosidimutans TaxID=496056 RepID=A0A4R3KQU9_9SPHI|nr:DUF1579 domain-containing protein [Anseongella ginsenosidimutans]QEC52671.1 DUF1579 domain-containing protein [Anseongella ginsenosidimutans]TCS86599.1 uncharacterized protein DUF1579 [Anseongella ginsenosidimutans]